MTGVIVEAIFIKFINPYRTAGLVEHQNCPFEINYNSMIAYVL